LYFCHCCGSSTVASVMGATGILEFAISLAMVLYVTAVCFGSSV
jgi:hypothetical protein